VRRKAKCKAVLFGPDFPNFGHMRANLTGESKTSSNTDDGSQSCFFYHFRSVFSLLSPLSDYFNGLRFISFHGVQSYQLILTLHSAGERTIILLKCQDSRPNKRNAAVEVLIVYFLEILDP